ncbi:MAG: glycosyltransferase [Parvularculaceae bacterium]
MTEAENRLDIAVILPCHNEEAAIAGVISEFRAALPGARIYVFDNVSTDGTARAAAAAGAHVRAETLKGKGNALRRAFADINADIFVIADGDGTYDAASAPKMIETMLADTLDMVVGVRAHKEDAAYRPGHVFGNRAFSFLFRRFFRAEYTDVLSGYRVLSRRFVKSFPSVSRGFEIETEVSAHAAYLRLPVKEVVIRYSARADGGESKLNTVWDGLQILRRMLTFLRLYRPLVVFGAISGLGALFSIVLAIPLLEEYLRTGLVPRFPTAILSASAMLAALIVFVVGVILDTQARYFAERKRLSYLTYPPPPAAGARVSAAD